MLTNRSKEIPREKRREIVLLLLFAKDSVEQDSALIDLVMGQLKVTRRTVIAAQQEAEAIFEKMVELDEAISGASREYAIDRIGKAEKNILRLALFEMRYQKPILPPAVVIAEAMRLTNKFSASDSAKFINAILDALKT